MKKVKFQNKFFFKDGYQHSIRHFGRLECGEDQPHFQIERLWRCRPTQHFVSFSK